MLLNLFGGGITVTLIKFHGLDKSSFYLVNPEKAIGATAISAL